MCVCVLCVESNSLGTRLPYPQALPPLSDQLLCMTFDPQGTRLMDSKNAFYAQVYSVDAGQCVYSYSIALQV